MDSDTTALERRKLLGYFSKLKFITSWFDNQCAATPTDTTVKISAMHPIPN